MKNLVLVIIASFVLIACSEKKQSNTLPAPASIMAVQKIVSGKTFVTERVGTLSSFASKLDKENPNQWFDEDKGLDDYAKEFQAERMKFMLEFVNDTLVRITDDNKTWDAIYKIDEEVKNEEKTGIKLRLIYPDKEGTMNFPGATEPMILTSTHFIAGIADKSLILELPRGFNRSTVVIWMNEKK